MRIRIENVADGERIPHAVLLIRGFVDCHVPQMEQIPLYVEQESDSNKTVKILSLTNKRFKFVTRLGIGVNQFRFQFLNCRETLDVTYICRPVGGNQIRLVYVTNRDEPMGRFQIPKVPATDLHRRSSIESARRRISLAGELIQCFLGDSLRAHQLEPRKSVVFHSDGEESPTVCVFESKLTGRETRSLNGEALWHAIGKELIESKIANADTKCIAILAATRLAFSDLSDNVRSSLDGSFKIPGTKILAAKGQ